MTDSATPVSSAILRTLKAVDPRIAARVRSLGQKGLSRVMSVRTNPRRALRDIPVPINHYPDRRPSDAVEANLSTVCDILQSAQIHHWLVRTARYGQLAVGVSEDDRARVIHALATTSDQRALTVRDPRRDSLVVSTRSLQHLSMLHTAPVLHVAENCESRGWAYGIEEGCAIEFWHFPTTVNGLVVAPRENAASRYLSSDDCEFVPTRHAGREMTTLRVFQRRMLDDLAFPIDVVYTWVDGDDPDWQRSKAEWSSRVTGIPFHPEAVHAARFRSRDELRFSLRALDMFAPWVNHVYLVTNGQVPQWLDSASNRLTLVSHDEIFSDRQQLPTFNSNAIVSQLHRIAGLSEHFIYFNDDVLLTRPVPPHRFFTPSGLALVSPANNRRPFGPATSASEPHFNLTRNMRMLLEDACGITISRAIKHTPHPQLVSVHKEMEARFPDAYARTLASRFRHHDDIAGDQLHHYYAQVTGRAVPAGLRYLYINILDDSYLPALERLQRLRNMDAICLNDAPVDGTCPIPDERVRAFLESYFPFPSDFESLGSEQAMCH